MIYSYLYDKVNRESALSELRTCGFDLDVDKQNYLECVDALVAMDAYIHYIKFISERKELSIIPITLSGYLKDNGFSVKNTFSVLEYKYVEYDTGVVVYVEDRIFYLSSFPSKESLRPLYVYDMPLDPDIYYSLELFKPSIVALGVLNGDLGERYDEFVKKYFINHEMYSSVFWGAKYNANKTREEYCYFTIFTDSNITHNGVKKKGIYVSKDSKYISIDNVIYEIMVDSVDIRYESSFTGIFEGIHYFSGNIIVDTIRKKIFELQLQVGSVVHDLHVCDGNEYLRKVLF